jgi:hypothetical protein
VPTVDSFCANDGPFVCTVGAFCSVVAPFISIIDPFCSGNGVKKGNGGAFYPTAAGWCCAGAPRCLLRRGFAVGATGLFETLARVVGIAVQVSRPIERLSLRYRITSG